MKRNTPTIVSILLTIALGLAACAHQEQPKVSDKTAKQTVNNTSIVSPSQSKPTMVKEPVPAFMNAETAKNLPPTLSPEIFTGTVRASYAAVKEIPQTIAQLPCYCHCDRSVGHKSLHSCFESDHAAKCGICMNSALEAYKLQKEQNLTPEQIRDRLVAEYDHSSM